MGYNLTWGVISKLNEHWKIWKSAVSCMKTPVTVSEELNISLCPHTLYTFNFDKDTIWNLKHSTCCPSLCLILPLQPFLLSAWALFLHLGCISIERDFLHIISLQIRNVTPEDRPSVSEETMRVGTFIRPSLVVSFNRGIRKTAHIESLSLSPSGEIYKGNRFLFLIRVIVFGS